MSRYLIFIIVSLSLLLVSISGTAVSVAFPVITAEFNVSLVLAGWVLGIYQLVSTIGMPLAGKAGEIFGEKPTFIFSLCLFIFGSLLCGLAPNIYVLIVARFIQGFGSASFLPLATGIVAYEFPNARQQAIGLFTSIFPIGQIVGPSLGGWLTESYGWQSIFWLNILMGIIVLIPAILLLRSRPKQKGRMDLVGAGLFSGSICSLMIGFSMLGNTENNSSSFAIILFIFAIISMVIFIRYENKVLDPIIDLQIIKAKPFMATNLYNLVFGTCVIGVMSFIPLYAVTVYNMSIIESGFLLTPRFIGMIIASTITSFSLKRWGYRWPIIVGSSITIVCLSLLGAELINVNIFNLQIDNTIIFILIMLFLGLGLGFSAPAANNACIELMPNRVATITGVRGLFRQTGGTIGIVLTSLILNNVVDIKIGFRIVLIGLAVIIFLCFPIIFMMPKAPKETSPVIDGIED